jgi:hypothetical protein
LGRLYELGALLCGPALSHEWHEREFRRLSCSPLIKNGRRQERYIHIVQMSVARQRPIGLDSVNFFTCASLNCGLCESAEIVSCRAS